MANECSSLNPDCIQKKGTPCPAYDSGKNCWEYDWVSVFKQAPKEEQEKWKIFMAEKCPKCAAYREPMKAMMEKIQKEI